MLSSYWLSTAPPFAAAPAALPGRAEVVILGAGIMGSALAYHLARAGQPPLVLERNAHPAGGATGRNGGLVVGGPAQAYAVTARRLGPAAAREITHLTQLNRGLLENFLQAESIAAGYAVTGFISLAASPEEAQAQRASAAAMQAEGFAAEWLDRPAAEACLGAALGPRILGGLFQPEAGVIHSARYAFGVAQAAARHGARFAYDTAVLSASPAPGGGWSLRTTRGLLRTEQLVLALNAWTSALFPDLAELIVPTRGHVAITAPVAFTLRPWSANAGYEYGRQLESGQLLVGGQRWRAPGLDRPIWPPPGANAPAELPELVAALADTLPELFPATRGLPLVHHWTGLMGFTPDDQPLAGPWPGRPGLWLLAGFSGHGMPFSQALPLALAARLTGQAGPAIPAAFDPARLLEP